MDIYEVLRTKPHSSKHLARYVKFIQSRKQQSCVLEKHHICPKATDLFPEYASLTRHSWNRVDLTPREHYIAHLLLWKAFGGSQTHAVKMMTKKSKRCSRIYQAIRTQVKNNLIGRTLSEDHKRKIGASHKERGPISVDTKAKLAKASRGNSNAVGKRTDEQRLRMSLSHKGRKPISDATRNKLKARIVTDENKAKRSASMKETLRKKKLYQVS